jgi:hypothetical protein
MTTPTYRGEVQLLDWGETRSTGAYIKLKLHPDDMQDGQHPFRGLERGERFAVIIAPFQDEPEAVEKPRRLWDELPATQQAVLRCNSEQFQQWLGVESADEAATWVRLHCGIQSRAELKTNHAAARVWRAIDAKYANAMGLVTEER